MLDCHRSPVLLDDDLLALLSCSSGSQDCWSVYFFLELVLAQNGSLFLQAGLFSRPVLLGG